MTPLPKRSLGRLALLAAMWLGAGCGPVAAPQGQGPAPGTSPTPAATVAPAVFPVTITDDAGRQVTVRQAPQRIVSAAPSNTEILFALGLDDRLAADTTFCDYPEAAKAKPKIGGLRPNVEAIVAQTPDLVLGVRGFPADVIASLEAQQIPVAIFNPPDFAGVLRNVRAIGRLTGAVAPAERVAGEMEGRWNAVAQRAKGAPSRPRVLFEIDASDPAAVSAAGPGTFIDAMITAAGGENVLATLTPGEQYPKISAEAVLQADPDLLILGDAPFGESAATVAQRPGWGTLKAVQRGQIVGVSDPNVTSRPGPRLAEGLELVAALIHPELFPAPASK